MPRPWLLLPQTSDSFVVSPLLARCRLALPLFVVRKEKKDDSDEYTVAAAAAAIRTRQQGDNTAVHLDATNQRPTSGELSEGYSKQTPSRTAFLLPSRPDTSLDGAGRNL